MPDVSSLLTAEGTGETGLRLLMICFIKCYPNSPGREKVYTEINAILPAPKVCILLFFRM